MKQSKMILAMLMSIVAILCVTIANADPRGFDEFNVPRTVLVVPPVNFVVGTGTNTSTGIDTRGFTGVAKLDVLSVTNTGSTGATLTLVVQTSPDTTNWTTVSNFFAWATNTTTVLVTNTAGTNMIGTNAVFFPGTIKTPVAATSGLAAQPFLVPLPYTNGATMTLTVGQPAEFGFSIEDLPNRYMRTILTQGTTTNVTAMILLTTPVPTYFPSIGGGI